MNLNLNNSPAITVSDLHKTFNGRRGHEAIKAVEGVNFDVPRGEIFSLLGPNGAGKTTTLAILSCLIRPDQGDAWVMGHSVRQEQQAVKALLGVVPQDVALYSDLTARENLFFWGRMYGLRGKALISRVDEVLELIGLVDRQNGLLSKYSGGMKRRVNIGVALLHRPPVMYLDEPTVGIDPQSRRNILDGIKALRDQGVTVLYTTHYMEEAQELSDRIAILDQGQMIACGTHTELIRIVGVLDRVRLGINGESEHLVSLCRGIPSIHQVMPENNTLSLLMEDSSQTLAAIFEAALAVGVRIVSVDIQEPNLETVFLHLTGRALRDEGGTS